MPQGVGVQVPSSAPRHKEKRMDEQQLRDLSGRPRVYQVKHILAKIKPDIERIAESVTLQNFGHVADAESKCGSSANYGHLPPFIPGQMWPEFEEAVEAAPIGEIVGPFYTRSGWHLIVRIK